ncbi:MAG: DUF2161 family putative PD-(D/E)XK-type phosphodiesterase [Flavimaricola sp.]|nr:DUF2161 family putative PD-(D/E)XK-type phosphodiesterase [Flavimaricola sp.]
MSRVRVQPQHDRPAREADLYPPVKAWLEAQGYDVRGEVGAADVVARRDGFPMVVVELKLGFSLALFHQGIARLALTDQVWLAVPTPGKRARRDNVAMARRLGLGVLSIRFRDGHVDELCAPGPYAPRKSAKKVARVEKAFDRLRGDPNAGGSSRYGIVTAYRADAIRCARFLAIHGPSKGSDVAQWTEVPVATRIMADNPYGWFERVSRGVYGLTSDGQKGLADYGDLDL